MTIEIALYIIAGLTTLGLWFVRKHIKLIHELLDITNDRVDSISRTQDGHHALLMRVADKHLAGAHCVARVAGAGVGDGVHVSRLDGTMTTDASAGPRVGRVTSIGADGLAVVEVDGQLGVDKGRSHGQLMRATRNGV